MLHPAEANHARNCLTAKPLARCVCVCLLLEGGRSPQEAQDGHQRVPLDPVRGVGGATAQRNDKRVSCELQRSTADQYCRGGACSLSSWYSRPHGN
jgi:hypothetical protein